MTLVLAVLGTESVWMLADRRLSYGAGRFRDDAKKVMSLDTPESTSILGYAGLGATAVGTEPGEWMSAVLRNGDLTLEQSLLVIARAMQRELPSHLETLPAEAGRSHHLLAVGFVGDEARMYSLDMELPAEIDKPVLFLRRILYVISPSVARTPSFAMAGSGVGALTRDAAWQRHIRRLVRAHDRGKIGAEVVAKELAAICAKVAGQVSDKSVGTDCIVVWRYRKSGPKKGGGGHLYYSDGLPCGEHPSIPSIVSGMDITAMLRVLSPLLLGDARRALAGEADLQWNKTEVDAALARLPDAPDERLR